MKINSSGSDFSHEFENESSNNDTNVFKPTPQPDHIVRDRNGMFTSSLGQSNRSSNAKPIDTEMMMIPPIPDPFKDLELYLDHESEKYPAPIGADR